MQDNGCGMLESWIIPYGMTDKPLDTRFSTRIASVELKAFRKAAKLDRRSVADAVRLAMELYIEKVYRDRGRTPPPIGEEVQSAEPSPTDEKPSDSISAVDKTP